MNNNNNNNNNYNNDSSSFISSGSNTDDVMNLIQNRTNEVNIMKSKYMNNLKNN